MKKLLFPFLILTSSGELLAAQNPREPVRLDPSATVLAFGPSVATEGDLSCAVWTETSTYLIKAAVSDGRGLTWSAPARLDTDLFQENKVTQQDSVAIADGIICVYWRDDRNGGVDQVYFARSLDAGATWEADKLVNHGYAVGTQAIRSHAMSVSGPYVYIAQRVDGPTGNDEIWLSASSDSGATFAPAVYVSSVPAGTADAINVDVKAQGSTVHVVWADDRQGAGEEVWYQRSDDAGATWLADDIQMDSSPNGMGDCQTLGLVVDAIGSRVAVSWEEDDRNGSGNEEVYVNLSQDGGNTWLASDVTVTTFDPAVFDADFSSMALTDEGVHVTWRDNRSGGDLVYVSTSNDAGLTFQEVAVGAAPGSTSPFFSVGDGILAVCYSSGSTPQPTNIAYSYDFGQSFTSEFSISDPNVGDVDQIALTYNSLYQNYIGAWQQDDPGTNSAYVGGFRPQSVRVSAPLTAGSNASFELSGFDPSQAGQTVQVFASFSLGGQIVPDGRQLGLAFDRALRATLQNPITGVLDAAGGATTNSTAIPSSLAGATLHFVGVSILGNQAVSLTDTISESIL